MKKAVKHVLLYISTFILSLAILWMMLSLSACIPNAYIRGNMEKSALYYRETEGFETAENGRLSTTSDHYADCILLQISYNMGKDNPLVSALDTKYYSGDDIGQHAGFYLAVTEDASPDTDYTRYWHGMAMFLRPMHLFCSVQTIRLLHFMAILFLAAITVFSLTKRKNYRTALALILAMCAIRIWDVSRSLEYESAFLLCFLLCPLYLQAERKKENQLPVLSVIGGTAVAFFDFLTCESIVLLLPLILVTAVRMEEKRFSAELWKLLLKCITCFLIAYAATFLCKWILASLVTGENKFVAAVFAAESRVGGMVGMENTGGIFRRMGLALMANLSVLFGGSARVESLRVICGISAGALVIMSVLYLFAGKERCKAGNKMLLFLGSIVFLRYIALSNHAYLHAFFTYRAMICSITALLAAVFLSVSIPQKKRGRKK